MNSLKRYSSTGVTLFFFNKRFRDIIVVTILSYKKRERSNVVYSGKIGEFFNA
jgi:hypothetical protein